MWDRLMWNRPVVGQLSLLVYAECICGAWCAFGEGGPLPICGGCGRRMVPGGGAPGQFGPLDDQGREMEPGFGRRHRSLGFVAFFTNEIQGVNILSRIRQALGLWHGMIHAPEHRAPYFTASEIAGSLQSAGFTTDPVWEGPPPWERPYERPDTDDYEVARGRWLQAHTSEEEPRKARRYAVDGPPDMGGAGV